MSKLLLFDLDGTLVSTQGAGMRAMRRAGMEVFGEAFSFDGIHVAGSLDPIIFHHGARTSGFEVADHHHETFKQAYHRLLPQELAAGGADVRHLPGAVELLTTLRQDVRATIGLLTGNYGVSADQKFRAVGIDPDWFAVRVFGDDAPDRPSLVPVGMNRYEALHGRRVPSRDVAVIGDTPRDVEAAHAHGCICFAVATGPYSVDELRATSADVVLENLLSPRPLWDWIAG